MAFYYNPITGEIQKVTPSQKKAYDEHFREERWTRLLDNETTLPTLIALGTTVLAGITAGAVSGWLIDKLEETGVVVTEGSKSLLSDTKYGAKLLTDIVIKPATGQGDQPVPLPPGVSAPVSVSYNEVINYGLERIGLGNLDTSIISTGGYADWLNKK